VGGPARQRGVIAAKVRCSGKWRCAGPRRGWKFITFIKFIKFTFSRPRTPSDAASYVRGHTRPCHPEDTRDLVVVLIAAASQSEMRDSNSVLPTSDVRPPTPDSEGLARFAAITRHGF
jgi:hypothetical protein